MTQQLNFCCFQNNLNAILLPSLDNVVLIVGARIEATKGFLYVILVLVSKIIFLPPNALIQA